MGAGLAGLPAAPWAEAAEGNMPRPGGIIGRRAGITECDFPPRGTSIPCQRQPPTLKASIRSNGGPSSMARRAKGPLTPLLAIAGAGSGKTNTLAHRVAHLIVNGADPRRILLMTFSRCAASETTKRVERIARKVLGDNAGVMTDALAWAGTFHGIGARLLREYADRFGLEAAFTIHDREDFRRPDEPDPP